MSDPFQGARPYQVAHIQALLRALIYGGAALDASDTGTGKTYCTLILARILGVVPLVLGPKAARAEWEIAAERVGVKVHFVNYERARGQSVKVNYHDPEIFGPSFVRLCKSDYGYEKLYGSGSCWVWTCKPTMMVFDECHKCTGSTTVNGKLLRSAKDSTQYVVALSATIAESPAQMKNIGILLGLFTSSGWRNWALKHGCKPGVFGGLVEHSGDDKDILDHALKKIHSQIFPARGARMRRSAIPGFPQTLIDVKLVGDGREAIAQMVEEITGLEPNDLRYSELRQLLDSELVEEVIDPVIDSIDNKRKVVIYPKYTKDLRRLVELLRKRKLKVAFIDGSQVGDKGDRERIEIKSNFQRNRLDALVVNQDAGNAALSLHDEAGEIERDTYLFPVDSGRILKQLFGRVQRAGGAFSRQFLLGFAGTAHETILLKSLARLERISILNDRELDSLRLL